VTGNAFGVPALDDLRDNMKYVLISITALLLSLSCFASEEMESDFLERLEAFVSEGDFSKEKLNEIWLVEDTPPAMFDDTLKGLKKLKKQGIGETRYHEIYPSMKERMNQPMEIEGKTYTSNLAPHRMIEIRYLKKITSENGFDEKGWSYVLGESEGRLYMMGLREQIKTE